MKMEIKNSCYEYVHLSVETYDTLKSKIDLLASRYKDEVNVNKELEDKITELFCENEILRLEILKSNVNSYRLHSYSLEDLLNCDSWGYAFDGAKVSKLLKLGFTHEDLNNFIKDEWKKLNEETKND